MDTRKLAQVARQLLADGQASTLEAAVSQVVSAELARLGGSTARQERLWHADVLRVAHAAERDGRALNGGADRGQGRVGDIAEQAARLARMTAREANRKAMSEEQLAAAVASLEAAARDLEAEISRRAR